MPVTLNEINISFRGSTNLSDIAQAMIFYTGDNPRFKAGVLFRKTAGISNELLFTGKQTLQGDTSYFWLAADLKKNATLTNKIVAQCLSVKLNNKTIVITGNPSPAPARRLGHALRQHNDDGVHTYRIPGLVTTGKGTLIAVYDIRRNGSVDLQEDIDIGMSRSTDGGQTWEPMKIIMDMGTWGGKPQDQNGIGDPSVLVDRKNNTIWVAGIWAHGHPGERNWWASRPGLDPEATSQLMLAKSEDDGLSWSAPINITRQVKAPKWHLLLQGPGTGITMEDGTLVFPAQYKDENEMPWSTILYSKDQGKTWQLGAGAKSNTTEAQVVELSDHSLMLNMRDNQGSGPNGGNGKGMRSVAITKDLGKTWEEHPSSGKALPEPVCNASLIRHRFSEKGEKKEILLFANPADQYERRNMTIKISFDEGLSWPEKYHMLLDEGRGRGYASLTSIDENTIGILYEGSQADLVFQKIPLKELLRTD